MNVEESTHCKISIATEKGYQALRDFASCGGRCYFQGSTTKAHINALDLPELVRELRRDGIAVALVVG